MNLSAVSLPKPIVPNIITAQNVITQDLIEHLDKRIANDQGLLVIDFTGNLIQTICARLPKRRVGDVFLLDAVGQDQFNFPANFLTVYPGEAPEVMVSEAVALFQLLYGDDFSDDEAALLRAGIQTIQAKLFQANIEPTDFFCPLYLVALISDANFRLTFTRSLWDMKLRGFWQYQFDQKVADLLIQKFRFVTADRRFVYGINRPYRQAMSNIFDVADVTRKGKIALISLPKSELDLTLIRYIAGVYFSRFERSALAGFPLEDCYFFNGTEHMEQDFQHDIPKDIDASPIMQTVLKEYSRLKYGDPVSFLRKEQRKLLGESTITHLDPILNTKSIYPNN